MKLKDDKKVEQIFEATLSLVKEKGLAGVTMGEIARSAGIATGTLYIYFKNKEELINTLFADCRKASIDSYFKNYDATKPFKSGFKVVWNNILEYRVLHFDRVVLMDQCYHSPFMDECTMKMTKQWKQPLFKLIERGKDENVFKDMDTFALLIFMIGSIHEGVKNAHYTRKPLNKATIEAMFNMCWDGMKK